MKLLSGILADLIVILHFCFVLFVMFGGLLVLKWRWMMWIHIPAALWGALIEFAGWICPLTPLENQLRHAAGGQEYQSGFIEHYVMPILYPVGLTREVQIILGFLVILLNAIIYGVVLYRREKSLKRRGAA